MSIEGDIGAVSLGKERKRGGGQDETVHSKDSLSGNAVNVRAYSD